MKREIIKFVNPGSCCPVHDKYPSNTYKNRRSIKKRSLFIKKEHRYVRRVVKQNLHKTSLESC